MSGSEDGSRRVAAAVSDPYLEACIQAAQAGGRAAQDGVNDTPITKSDPHMGHHAVVSGADYRSQGAVLEVLAAFRAHSWVVCEEAVTGRVAGLRIGDDSFSWDRTCFWGATRGTTAWPSR